MARRTVIQSPQRFSGSRRKTNWIPSGDATTFGTLVAGGVVLDQVLTAAAIQGLVGPESTIVRTRGLLAVWSDQVAATETVFGAMGMAIVSDAAATAGAGSIPAPYTDAGWDGWFMHQFFSHTHVAGSTLTSMSPTQTNFPFDSKAMRRLQDEEAVVVLIEDGSALHGGRYTIDFRQLFKLH